MTDRSHDSGLFRVSDKPVADGETQAQTAPPAARQTEDTPSAPDSAAVGFVLFVLLEFCSSLY